MRNLEFLQMVAVLTLTAVGCSSGEAAQGSPGEGAGDGNSTAGTIGSTGDAGGGNVGGQTAAGGAGLGAGGGTAGAGVGGGAAAGSGAGGTSGGGTSNGGASSGGTSGGAGTGDSPGARVTMDASGNYTVKFVQPAWTFGGKLGAPATGVSTTAGTDTFGAYHETAFSYTHDGARNGRIRAYDQAPVVIFGEKNPASASNDRNFPVLSTLPTTPYHLAYQDIQFAPYTMTGLTPDSPWVFFDANANAFILSAGSHFMNAETSRGASNAISVGISSQIGTLPAGFEQTAVLAADTGINQTFEDWGSALRKFGGKQPIPSDATADLANFGYWTDNGASYYYATQNGVDYQTTVKNVRSYFEQLGTPIGYVQLDSWWYPKGTANTWQGSGTNRGGEYLYQADTTLFPNGLLGFQQSLGLPLVTHARWIDAASPYRTTYKMSGNVSTDPAFWAKIASYLKDNGVLTYEQDWLNQLALPSTSNLTDQDAFTDNMAAAMATAGIKLQYCMGLPRHYLQGTKYQNLVTTRVNDDRFNRNRWRVFFYTSRLTWAAGAWPWTDVFMSTEHDNLLLSTMTGGMMGIGDAVNKADKASILRAIRKDGVLIKPDVPILLLDRSIIAEAQGKTNPSIASTYSQHTGGRTTYLFAFTDSSTSLSFMPSELGYTGSVYVYDVNHATGRLLDSAQPNTDTIADTAYYVLAPVGTSGIAFLGEQGKLAALGKKRISDWSDNGTLSASVVFATGETAVTLQGYSPSAPVATADVGTVGAVQYDATTKRFTVSVSPTGSSATVKLHL